MSTSAAPNPFPSCSRKPWQGEGLESDFVWLLGFCLTNTVLFFKITDAGSDCSGSCTYRSFGARLGAPRFCRARSYRRVIVGL